MMFLTNLMRASYARWIDTEILTKIEISIYLCQMKIKHTKSKSRKLPHTIIVFKKLY